VVKYVSVIKVCHVSGGEIFECFLSEFRVAFEFMAPFGGPL